MKQNEFETQSMKELELTQVVAARIHKDEG